MTKILLAGGSGYIGRALLSQLSIRFPQAEIIVLSRSGAPANEIAGNAKIRWLACDLFSLRQLEQAVPEGISLAYYLVHSMLPTAQLDQGSFADYDLILADNFARLAAKRKIERVIYLGGLIPERGELSEHLRSRLEIEEVFSRFQLPITILRAGLILGPGGSSFQILLKLVERLPLMICPHWTQTQTTPVALDQVVSALLEVAENSDRHQGKIYDLAGCKPISYIEMMRETARLIGRSRIFIRVPMLSPVFSRLWVTLVTGAPRALVYPLVESLAHTMVARADHQLNQAPQRSFSELLKLLPREAKTSQKVSFYRPRRKTVRSVQRLPNPKAWNMGEVMVEYARWLPQFIGPWIRSEWQGSQLSLCLFSPAIPLLKLRRSSERSGEGREILYIEGGWLARSPAQGRLEFREVLGGTQIIAAIHDFRPALPWFLYQATQARIHLWVMKSFAKHLAKQ